MTLRCLFYSVNFSLASVLCSRHTQFLKLLLCFNYAPLPDVDSSVVETISR